jgi:hypothetical protein
MSLESRGQSSSYDQNVVLGSVYQAADYSQVLTAAAGGLACADYVPLDTNVVAGPFVECELVNVAKGNIIEMAFSSRVAFSGAVSQGIVMQVVASIDDFATQFAIDGCADVAAGVLGDLALLASLAVVRSPLDFPRIKFRLFYTTGVDPIALGGQDGTGVVGARTTLWVREIGGGIVIHGDSTVT